MTERDWLSLFSYFIGEPIHFDCPEHAVHVRALVHAGFDVRPDKGKPDVSWVYCPESGARIGIVIGENKAAIRKSIPNP